MSNLRLLDPSFSDSFESALRRFFAPVALDADTPMLQMRIDVREKDNAYEVKADIPGVKKEDINVRIDGNVVQIDAEVKREKETRATETGYCAASATTARSRAASAWPMTWTTAKRKRPTRTAC
jgi:HSP20 family molecular chaperone IbpA